MRTKPSRPLALCATVTAVLCGAAAVATSAAPLPAAKNPKTTTVKVAGNPKAGVSAAGKLWVIVDRAGERRLLELHPGTGRATGRSVGLGAVQDSTPQWTSTAIGVRPSLTAAGGALWTIDAQTREILRIDPASLTVTARIPERAHYIAAGPGGLWAAGDPVAVDPSRPWNLAGLYRPLLRVDPASATIVQRLNRGPRVPETVELAVGRDVVWIAIAQSTPRNLLAVSPADGTTTELGTGGWQMYARGGTLYSTTRYSCAIEIRTPSKSLAPKRSAMVGSLCPWRAPRDVAAGPARSVWLAQYRPREANGRLVQASLTGTGPTRIFTVGRDPVDVVPGRNAVWVLNDSDRTITRVPAKPLPKR